MPPEGCVGQVAGRVVPSSRVRRETDGVRAVSWEIRASRYSVVVPGHKGLAEVVIVVTSTGSEEDPQLLRFRLIWGHIVCVLSMIQGVVEGVECARARVRTRDSRRKRGGGREEEEREEGWKSYSRS